MRIGIVGLPLSGKTTVFNAVTRGHAQLGTFGGGQKVNIGSCAVPDGRLERLAKMYRPERIVHAEVTYVDFPGPPSGKETDIFTGDVINQLQQTDALMIVARAFHDESVPHPLGVADLHRDVEKLLFDLSFADIAILDKRIERMTEEIKAARAAEREATEKTINSFRRLQERLESGIPIRSMDIDEATRQALAGTSLLSSRPLIVVLNIDEEDLARAEELEGIFASTLTGSGSGVAAVCGKLETELSELSEEEETEMREALGVPESSLDRMIRVSYSVLGLVSFFTHGGGEVKAWPVELGTPAVRAAGHVHSDMERGFIRAEVVGYDDLVASGGWQNARKAGILRREGREYVIQDGDVINFLFSV